MIKRRQHACDQHFIIIGRDFKIFFYFHRRMQFKLILGKKLDFILLLSLFTLSVGQTQPKLGHPIQSNQPIFQLLQCSRGLEFGVLFMVSLPYPWKKKRVTSKNYVIWNWSCVQSATVDVHFIQVRTVLESKYQSIRKWVLFEFLVKEKCSASVLLHVFDNNNTGKSSNMT